MAAVAARKDIDGDAVVGEEVRKRDHDGCFAAAAGGEIADADDGMAEGFCAQDACVVSGIFAVYGECVERHQRSQARCGLHAGFRRKALIAAAARSAAPECSSKA